MKTLVSEQETIIIFNEGDTTANVYTHNRTWQHHLEALGVKPWRVQGRAKDYTVPKSWLRLPRKPSERRREASRKALKERGGKIKRQLVAVG